MLPFDRWIADLEARHLADLRTQDVARALRALSSAYVERRARGIGGGRALDGAGKRAAFALYYAPLHFLLVRHIAQALHIQAPPGGLVVDLGCGTGAAGAAIIDAMHPTSPTRPTSPTSPILALDSHPWALDEARQTLRVFAIDAAIKRVDAARTRLPRQASLIVAAFLVNELRDEDRATLLPRLLESSERGSHVLVVEPIARRLTPWWPDWAHAFTSRGGRSDDWKIPVDAPPLIARLGHAAGLTADVVTGRSLWLGARGGRV